MKTGGKGVLMATLSNSESHESYLLNEYLNIIVLFVLVLSK
jgi:hypothetical protein